MDGHGGWQCAEYLVSLIRYACINDREWRVWRDTFLVLGLQQKHLIANVDDDLKQVGESYSATDVEKILRRAFQRTDEALLEQMLPPFQLGAFSGRFGCATS